MRQYYSRTERMLRFAFVVWAFALCAALAFLAYTVTAHAEPRPAVVMPSSGQPIYIHPPASPTAPAVVLPPASLPIYVHPAPSTYAPATVIIPGEMPIFVYPGVIQ